jgi:hypothetical protein
MSVSLEWFSRTSGHCQINRRLGGWRNSIARRWDLLRFAKDLQEKKPLILPAACQDLIGVLIGEDPHLKRLCKVDGQQSPDCERLSCCEVESLCERKAKFGASSIPKSGDCLIGAVGLGEVSVIRALVEIWAVSQGGWKDRCCRFKSKAETKIDDI